MEIFDSNKSELNQFSFWKHLIVIIATAALIAVKYKFLHYKCIVLSDCILTCVVL